VALFLSKGAMHLRMHRKIVAHARLTHAAPHIPHERPAWRGQPWPCAWRLAWSATALH